MGKREGHQVGEAESHSEETPGKRETAGEARERARKLRAQAALAWLRVQRVIQQRKNTTPSAESILEALHQLPTATYLGGIAGSLIASAWLYATGRRAAGSSVALSTSLVFGLALYVKSLRRHRRL